MLQRIVDWICDKFFGSEYKCPKCSGKGRYDKWDVDITGFTNSVSWRSVVLCEICKGRGRIDWIEKVVGKR